jgi:hypothetical protein
VAGEAHTKSVTSWQMERDNLLDKLSELLKTRDRALPLPDPRGRERPELQDDLTLARARMELV